jgi:flagellar motility protein MotE (MotC chaperone)
MAKKNKEVKSSETQGSVGQKKAGGLISGILAVLVALLLVAAVFVGAFYFLVKNNIYGVGELLRPSLQGNSILKLALPKLAETVVPDDPKNITAEELPAKYAQYFEKVKTLTSELDKAKADLAQNVAEQTSNAAILLETKTNLDKNQAILDEIAKTKLELQAMNKEMAGMIASGDSTGFKQYFEKVDPESAKRIYAELSKTDVANANAKDLARPYELMERVKGAEVLKQLWTKDRVLALTILAAAKPLTLAEILQNMDASLAADITQSLADNKAAQAAAAQDAVRKALESTTNTSTGAIGTP